MTELNMERMCSAQLNHCGLDLKLDSIAFEVAVLIQHLHMIERPTVYIFEHCLQYC